LNKGFVRDLVAAWSALINLDRYQQACSLRTGVDGVSGRRRVRPLALS